MSWNLNRHGLPFLPGYTFGDVTKSTFHRPQTLSYKNGYALPRCPAVSVRQDPPLPQPPINQEPGHLSHEPPDYDFVDRGLSEKFVPAYVVLDNKVLRFFAYFREDILYSPEEEYRVRPVVIYYYLVDNSMCIIEPREENSGMLQGKRVKRQRLCKNERGDYWHWQDLNLRMDLQIFGTVYHITHCDAFTEEFMDSQGIVLNDPEPMPADPYIKRRKVPVPCYITPSNYDSLYQYLTMDRKVLRFFALWEDSDCLKGETSPVIIHYYLVDDTVEVREVHEPNSGREPFALVMRRQRLPKKVKTYRFPSCVLEISKAEVEEYYSPRDFHVGQRVKLLGRSFLLYDCDGFTKAYYQEVHPDIQMNPIKAARRRVAFVRKKEIPPYNGFGSLEDSLQNCLSIIPKRPRINVMKMLENSNKVLRYVARLDSHIPEDQGRRFVLSYYLATDTLSIFERHTRNSGMMGGQFLKKMRVLKPGSSLENPQYYSPADFAIGATVKVFSHRFVLIDADLYVLAYLESIASQIPVETLNSLRQKLGVGTEHVHDRAQPDGQGDHTDDQRRS